jgi:mxaA protein
MSPHLFYLSRTTLVLLACLACLSVHAEQSPIHAISVKPQQVDGLVIGALLPCEIRLAVSADWVLQTASLPQKGSAVTDFLEVRESSWQQQDLADERVYHINLVYQVFQGVREPESFTVPPLTLRFKRGDELVEAQAPAWTFKLHGLIPANTPDEAVILRDALPPPDYPAEDHRRGLAAMLAGFLGMGIFAAWRLNWLPFFRRTPPFVRAAAGLKRLRRKPVNLYTWQKAAKLVHDAINETAGYAVFAGQLGQFLGEQPQYLPAQADLTQFFTLSERLFFAHPPEIPVDFPLSSLENLCQKLAEAGAER